MTDYCDTNILTAFVNKERLKTLGEYAYRKFEKNISSELNFAESKSRNIKSCVISRHALVKDLGGHLPSLGAVLTSTGIKEVRIKKVNGIEKGKEIYNKACGKVSKESEFYGKFCDNQKIKLDENIKHNELNDIRHFGSAVELGATRFITINKKDFKPLKNVIKMEIV